MPPSIPEIYDGGGEGDGGDGVGVDGVGGESDALIEGQTLALRCRVRAGKPAPVLAWFRDGRRLPSTTLTAPASSASSASPAQRVELLRLGPLRRGHQDARLTCRATNGRGEHGTASSSFLISMHRKSSSQSTQEQHIDIIANHSSSKKNQRKKERT